MAGLEDLSRPHFSTSSPEDLENDGDVDDRVPSRAEQLDLSQLSTQLKRCFTIHDRSQLAASVGAENLVNTNNLDGSTTSNCTGTVIDAASSSDLFRKITAAPLVMTNATQC